LTYVTRNGVSDISPELMEIVNKINAKYPNKIRFETFVKDLTTIPGYYP